MPARRGSEVTTAVPAIFAGEMPPATFASVTLPSGGVRWSELRGSVVSTNTGSATFIEDLPMPAAFGVAFPEKRDPLKYRTTWSRVM